MKKDNRKLGRYYEDMAADYLGKMGLSIIERNFYSKLGEIDIIARQGDNCLVFIEVKYCKYASFGFPEEAVDAKKIKKIRDTALLYIEKKGLSYLDVRFDIVSILDKDINWIIGAF